ncbi:MAG: Ig-like domain-containing protein [Candidatus Methanofastidiosia archaeon]
MIKTKKILKTLLMATLALGLIATDAFNFNENSGIYAEPEDTTPPYARWDSPAYPGEVFPCADCGGMGTLRVYATDESGIYEVEFYIDDNFIGLGFVGSYPNYYNVNFNTLNYSNGQHNIKAIVFDNSSNRNSTTITSYIGILNEEVEATIDFDPDTLNKKSKGKYVTVYIELPEGYDVSDIDLSTVLLNETVSLESKFFEVGDHDNDGIPDLMIKFLRASVIAILDPGDSVEIRIIGNLSDGTEFEGTDTIRVIGNI